MDTSSYNPVFDGSGNVSKIVEYALDVTERKLRDANFQSQVANSAFTGRH